MHLVAVGTPPKVTRPHMQIENLRLIIENVVKIVIVPIAIVIVITIVILKFPPLSRVV